MKDVFTFVALCLIIVMAGISIAHSIKSHRYRKGLDDRLNKAIEDHETGELLHSPGSVFRSARRGIPSSQQMMMRYMPEGWPLEVAEHGEVVIDGRGGRSFLDLCAGTKLSMNLESFLRAFGYLLDDCGFSFEDSQRAINRLTDWLRDHRIPGTLIRIHGATHLARVRVMIDVGGFESSGYRSLYQLLRLCEIPYIREYTREEYDAASFDGNPRVEYSVTAEPFHPERMRVIPRDAIPDAPAQQRPAVSGSLFAAPSPAEAPAPRQLRYRRLDTRRRI